MICKNCGYDDNGTGDFAHACKPQPAPSVPDVDALAQFIRKVDGSHQLGAGELAERIAEWLKAAPEAKP